MKKSLIFIGCLFAFCFQSFAQPCTGNLFYSSQAQVNNFRSTYPGCSIWNGNIGIHMGNVSNVDSLVGLTKVNGSLSFTSGLGNKNFDGLNNLTEVTQDFNFINIDSVKRFNNFIKGGNLKIENARKISAFNNISKVNNLNILTFLSPNLI